MKSLAVIGTGIAGMSAAYFLRDHFDVTFFEKENYPGGHTNTLTVQEDGEPVYIDSGFMVYNEITYPNLIRFFQELDIPTKPTSMSFSVQHLPSGLDYCGTGWNGLFAQRKNIVSPKFWRMLLDIDRFNKESVEILDQEQYLSYSLEQYIKEKGYGDDFLYKFLVPMSSAVWSTPVDLMLKFPAVTLVRFFSNHGFLGMDTHFQWRTVVGGSRTYRDKVLAMFPQKVMLSNPAVRVTHEGGKAAVVDAQGTRRMFDKVVIASHADEALAMLGDPTSQEKKLLGAFSYHKNLATLHTDERVMPRTRRAWSSWNYRIEADRQGNMVPSTVYDMNSLQQVSSKKNYFVSINGAASIDPSKIIWQKEYTHPLYNVEAIQAQKELHTLNHNHVRFFCGSYFRYGFHEDAFSSGLEAARAVRGERIWS